jgi:RNA polymerase sigma-70 factor (ECF subfamily)
VGEQRAPLVQVPAPAVLPRSARRYAERLVFVERIEPSEEILLDLDTSRLVTRFQAGERDAFGEIYLRYFDRVYSYMRVLFRQDRHEAEDLTQQVFARALEALPRYERRPQPFRAWLFTIARNQALTQLERLSHSHVVEPAEMARRNTATYEDERQIEALDWLTDRELVMFVERLPVAQRQVLVLRYMLDLPTSEISRILELSADHVRTLEHRALRFLQARLRAIGRGPQPSVERRPMDIRGRVKWLPVARQRRYALH